MPSTTRRRHELETLSPEVAWKLVEPLFHQKSSLAIGACIFMMLGLIGFAGTGSFWYLGGVSLSFGTFMWRLWQTHIYLRDRDSATPLIWARRCARGGWLTAAGWGAWSTVVLFEPDKTFVLMVIGAQSACMIGASVRNCGVRSIADAQALLTLTPLFVSCLVSDSIYLNLYSAFVALHVLAALALTKSLHDQTLRLLLQDEEKTDLVARLEVANQDLEVINKHLESLVSTDALTDVANRRAFDLALAREWRRSLREQVPLSLLMIDVDHFKAYNDFYGHQAGDRCLQLVAKAIVSTMHRPGDMVARYGGEEFAVILPGTYLDGAGSIAETVLAALVIPHDASQIKRVTVSIGAACAIPEPGTAADRLTGRADAALYAAKRGGRNAVHLAHSADMPSTIDSLVSSG